jgi:hypothetical protein
MQPQVGNIAHVHPRHYADFSQLRKHMVAVDRKLKRNQTAKNVRRWECCTILHVSQVEHLLMYWPHSLLQPPGLKLHSLHSNRKPKSKLPWADMIEERTTPSLAYKCLRVPYLTSFDMCIPMCKICYSICCSTHHAICNPMVRATALSPQQSHKKWKGSSICNHSPMFWL